MTQYMTSQSKAYFTLLFLLLLMTLNYNFIYNILDSYKLSVPLTFSHHVLEYLFFFKRGYGLCNPLSLQGRQWILKEKVFFSLLLLSNILILNYYYEDVAYSENLYNSFAFFHCFTALFFFWEFFKGSSFLKSFTNIIILIILSIVNNYMFFFRSYSDFSEWLLAYLLDSHLVIWLIIFIFGIKRKEISFASIIVILSFWLFYFSPWGWFLDYIWIFFSFNHITFESYVLLFKKKIQYQQ